MDWESAKHIEDNNYELPGHWLYIEYFEALNILFRVENSLRVFVYIILKNKFNNKWIDLSISSDDNENSTIGAIAKKRLSQDKNYACLGYVITSPLLHLTSGELIRIITSDAYWKYFKEYFPGSEEIIKSKLDEIGNVRNSLAHFRPLNKGDIELVKQNSIHALSTVERTIEDILYCPDIVPTNTEENWYRELITLGIQNVEIKFSQSKDEEWIRLIVSFQPPKLSQHNRVWRHEIKTINLKTDQLLINYPNFTKYVISTTEVDPGVITGHPEEFQITKSIRFTFSRETIGTNYLEIKSELESILLLISKEMALIKEDNLARGKLIDVISYYIETDKDGTSIVKGSNFLTELNGKTPPEFWGVVSYRPNFVTNTDIFPWMPIEVSKDRMYLPF